MPVGGTGGMTKLIRCVPAGPIDTARLTTATAGDTCN